MPTAPQIRLRRPDDIATLVAVLAEQQPHSHYPLRWPLPFPVEEFIVRAAEERAWVAESDGRVVGHVAVTGVAVDLVGPDWPKVTGRAAADLRGVATLFVEYGRTGRGIGRALLDTAVAWIHASGRQPVLDVVGAHPPTVSFYRNRGWQVIGSARPDWLPAEAPDVVLMALPADARAPVSPTTSRSRPAGRRW